MSRAPAVGDAGVPRLHLVTDDDVLAHPAFPDVATRLLRAGAGHVALHVRGPRTTARALYAWACALLAPAREAGAWLVVNDRVDVALTVGVRRVHLGGRSLPVAVSRDILGEGAGVGVSAHGAPDVAAAAEAGADWIFAGTIYATPGHPGLSGSGPRGVAEAVGSAAGIPVLGIGGVTPERVAELRAAGAHGVAVIRGVWRAPDPIAALRAYLQALALEAGVHGRGGP
jgi:thiamine-phosphate diphosphorylase